MTEQSGPTKEMTMRSVKVLCVAMVFGLAACGPKVASIEIGQKSVEMGKKGDSATLTVTPKDAEGKKVEGVQVTFTSSDPTVASVDAAGKIAAVGSGDTKVTVALDKVSVDVPVKVSIPTSISFAPAEVKLTGVGDKRPVVAKVMDSKSREVKATVAWSSADAKIATVAGGEITAVGAGDTQIFAAVGELKAGVKVSVTVPVIATVEADKAVEVKVGEKARLKVMAKDADGKEIGNATFTFKSDDVKVAAVDAVGEVSGVAKGKTKITVTAGEKSAAVEVKVKK
jgi:uncharacterized protein YjdB